MLLNLVFAFMLLLSCAYAAAAGGEVGRYCAILFVTASILSMFPVGYFNWQSTDLFVFGVDVLCFLCLVILAMSYNRGWLIWIAGLQLAAITTHIATTIAPDFSPKAYQALTEFWSIPILLLMVAGISLDRKRTS